MGPHGSAHAEATAYDEVAQERWAAEPAKQPGRSPFERDRARVLHSSALRRLAGKTQVVGPDEGDFPRTRLTHSLECAQIGRELGAALGCDPDLVDTACLAHDLGHPPFGHNGEAALDAVARPCGGFEGNAQSLRILTRLEAKTFHTDGRCAGLNLTRAALDAATKYPWTKPASPPPSGTDGQPPGLGPPTPGRDTTRTQAGESGGGPYGVYAEDLEVFDWIRRWAPRTGTCLEAQVMDWADDVAYSVHDLEDGVYAGHIELVRLKDPSERRAVCRVAARYTDASVAELDQVFGRLLTLPYWPDSYDADARSLAALKDLTSQLIGRFCGAAESGTRREYGHGRLRRYDANLVVPRGQRLECAVLKAMAARYVMSREGASGIRAYQREMIEELAGALWDGAPASLDPALRPSFAAAGDDGERLRIVVDQVAALTDMSAVMWHRRLTGRAGDLAT